IAFRLQLARYRSGVRRLVDGLRFGSGRAERLAAALVVSALSCLIILLVCGISAAPAWTAIGTGLAALAIAWGTMACFILGPDDEDVSGVLASLPEQLAVRKAEFAVLHEEARLEAEDAKRRHADAVARSLELEEEEEAAQRRRPTRQHCPYCDEVI